MIEIGTFSIRGIGSGPRLKRRASEPWDGIARDELPLAASILSFVYVPPGVPPDGSQLDELPMAPSIHAFTYTT